MVAGKRPFFTWFFALLVAVGYWILPLWESSLYGQGVELNWGFSPQFLGWSHWSSILTAPFVHLGLSHFCVNILFFLVFSGLVELRYGWLKNLQIVVLAHFLTLCVVSFVDLNVFLGKRVYFGSSHIVFSLWAFWSLSQKVWVLLFPLMGYFLYEVFSLGMRDFYAAEITHFIGFLAGTVLGLVALKKNHKDFGF